jgi:hypothetical protein
VGREGIPEPRAPFLVPTMNVPLGLKQNMPTPILGSGIVENPIEKIND